MAKKSKAARLVAELDGWEDRELEELAAMVQALLESRKEEEPVEDADEDGSSDERQGGHVELKMINGYGPYRYLRYWSGGKLKSQYLGKVGGKEESAA
jgi:hypothetical protein